jgi:hypothetical protein
VMMTISMSQLMMIILTKRWIKGSLGKEIDEFLEQSSTINTSF